MHAAAVGAVLHARSRYASAAPLTSCASGMSGAPLRRLVAPPRSQLATASSHLRGLAAAAPCGVAFAPVPWPAPALLRRAGRRGGSSGGGSGLFTLAVMFAARGAVGDDDSSSGGGDVEGGAPHGAGPGPLNAHQLMAAAAAGNPAALLPSAEALTAAANGAVAAAAAALNAGPRGGGRPVDYETQDSEESVDGARRRRAAAQGPGEHAGAVLEPLLGELGFQLSVGGVAGFCSGYAVKKVSKLAAFAIGVAFIGVQVARYKGLISDVDWAAVEATAVQWLDADGDGKITTRDLHIHGSRAIEILGFNLPSGAAFGTAFLLGLRLG